MYLLLSFSCSRMYNLGSSNYARIQASRSAYQEVNKCLWHYLHPESEKLKETAGL